jgi:hypothetical protein
MEDTLDGRRFAGDGNIAELPWASVFDPEINMRAVTAIQTRGFRAASEVVNRLVQIANGNPARDDEPSEPPGESSPDVSAFLALWERLLRQVTGPVGGAGPTPAGVTTLDLGNTESRQAVCLQAGVPGEAVSEVWLHNGGHDDLGGVRLRCSDLLAHDGMLVDASAVRFDPDVVTMPARSSRGVRVKAVVAEDVRPCIYRGMLLVDGHPDAWLPVVLEIRPDGS